MKLEQQFLKWKKGGLHIANMTKSEITIRHDNRVLKL